MKGRLLACGLGVLALVASPPPAVAQSCSGFPAGGTLNGVINTYYPAPNTVATVTIAAGSTCIRLVNASPPRQGAAALIAAGDLLLVVQMQGAPLNVTNTECYGDNTDEAPAGCTASTTSGDGSGSTSRTAGLYEYVIATAAVTVGATNPCGAGAGVTGDFVTVTAGTTGAGLINSYVSQRSAGGTGQTTYQVIRVPQYQTAQVGNAGGTATVTAAAWNGRSGGIVAFDVAGTLTVQTNSGVNPPPAISVDGQGFRGGTPVTQTGTGSGTPADFDYRQDTSFPVHANKAEGIAGTPSTLTGMTIGATAQGYLNGDRARGAPGNAGGGGSDGRVSANDQNSGGGGGGNGGRGGKGGNAWNSNEPFGGWGGAPYTASTTQLLMGGGGGAGTNNNNPGKSGGAAGGGMIFVRANTVTGTATFSANGNAAPDLEATAGNTNDSGGGGGAGGTITVLAATALPATLTLNASGGFGANANAGTLCASDAHGPGGGGAGGVVFTSNTSPIRNVNGANPGLTNSIGAGGCNCPTPPANKVPAGTCIQYSATAGTTGQLLTGTINSLPGVRTCVTSTRASLTGLRVGPSSVEFATACERDSLAFDVFATDDSSGEGARRRVGGSPLPARPGASVGPQVYRAEGRVEGPFVVIEEIERSGRRIRHGPFPADDAPLLQALDRAEEQRERLAVAAQGAEMRRAATALAAASASSSSMARSGVGARVEPVRPVAPMAPPSVSAVKIETRGRGSVEVSLESLRAAGLPARALLHPRRLRLTNLGLPVRFSLREDDDHVPVALAFEAEPLETDYTDRNAYVVSLQGARAPSVALTRSGFPRRPGTRVETNSFYVPFVARAADPWLWAFLGTGPSQVAFDLPGLAAAGGEVPVRVGLVGGSEHEHRVSVALNGALVGEARFRGRTTADLQGSVPASALMAAGNILALTYDGGDAAAFAFLDVVDLGVVARVDPPAAVVSVVPYQPATALAGVEYLIVSHPDFLAAAQRIAAAKKADGLRARVVDATGAYDRFSAGVFEANAVAALVRETRRTSPRLRYLLLVGDDTFDPKDHLGLGLRSYLPSPVGWDGEFGRVPAETFADTNGDGRPELAVGRLPVETADEAQALALKLERQDDLLRAGQGRQVFAVDATGPEDAPFREMADEVAAGLPSEAIFADAAGGVDAARETLLAALRDGAELTQYFGHGGNEQWSVRRMLDTTTAASLAGSGRVTVALSWTCESDWFQYHLDRSLGETLLLLPDGGTVASFGPSGIASPRAQAVFYRRVYAGLRQGLSLGEAVRQARAYVVRREPWAAPALSGFNLLGDPSLVPLPTR